MAKDYGHPPSLLQMLSRFPILSPDDFELHERNDSVYQDYLESRVAFLISLPAGEDDIEFRLARAEAICALLWRERQQARRPEGTAGS